MKFTITALSVGLLVSQVSASAVFGRSSFARSLQARQIDPNGVPDECKAICTPIITTINTCGATDPACLCTADVDKGVTDCLSCEGSVEEAGFAEEAAKVLQTYQQGCAAAGSPVPSLVLSTGAVAATPSASDSISGSATTDASVSESASASATPSGSNPSGSASATAPPSASKSASGSGGSSSASSTGSGTPSPSSNGAAPIVDGLEGTIIAGLGSLFVLLGL